VPVTLHKLMRLKGWIEQAQIPEPVFVKRHCLSESNASIERKPAYSKEKKLHQLRAESGVRKNVSQVFYTLHSVFWNKTEMLLRLRGAACTRALTFFFRCRFIRIEYRLACI